MNYGLQLSASGVLTSLYRQDVLTNNLSNATTVGFKPDMVFTRQRDASSVENDLGHMPSNRLLERLGGGAMMAPNRVSHAQGALETTGNPLDLALQGEGFFAVMERDDNGEGHVRFTRDGRFTMDEQGRLVTSTRGLAVLDNRDRPIRLPRGESVHIDERGLVRVDGNTVARLQVSDVADRDGLRRGPDGLFIPDEGTLAERRTGTGMVRQGVLEQGAVDQIQAMMAMTGAARDAQANLGMVTYHDRVMERAINGLGRVS